MARQIEAYKLRTELSVDARAGQAAMKSFQKDVDNVGQSFKKLGPQIDEAGKKAGSKFGEKFGAAATTVITGSFDKLGETLGSIIGTAMAPGIGTVIGQTVGSAVDKLGGAITPMLKQGYELNKMLEQTSVEFTTFAGSAKQAQAYLEGLKKFAHETGTDLALVVDSSERLYDLTGNLELSTKILRAATDQAADFGGKAETIVKVADALGLVAEKGDLAARDLKTLFKLGIDAKRYLADATGMSEKQIARMIAQGRVRGEVAARVIAEGIERQKGGFAARLATTTAGGAERRAGVAMQLTEVQGTQALTQGMKDLYTGLDKVLSSDTAKDLVNFMNRTAGTMIDFTEKGVMAGINMAQGVAEGITSNDSVKAVSQSINDFQDYLTGQLFSVFGIKSPSQLMIDEVGIPLGQGLALGMAGGFVASFGATRDQIVQTLEGLLQDPKIQALLATIQKAEGGKLNVMAGGREVLSGAAHPGEIIPKSQWFQGGKGPSSAAGLYQITRTNWRRIAPILGLTNFSDPKQQKLAALYLMSERSGGLGALTSGDPQQMMALAAKDWTSTPGSRIGGGRQVSANKWLGQFNQSLANAGVQPVAVVQWGTQDIKGMGSAIFGGAPEDIQGAAKGIFGQAPEQTKKVTEELSTFVDMINDTIPVIVDVNAAQDEAIKIDVKRQNALARMSSINLQAITPIEGLTEAVAQHATTSIQLTKDYQNALKKELFTGMSMITQISGALEQVGGFAPQETVGKKRGLFSKILGVAAPFLSFIPGIGPIAAAAAGMASAGLGGNWAGVVQGTASGLAAGGVFRRAERTPLAPGSAGRAFNLPYLGFGGHRQYGGPVYAGQSYVVGETGQETFTPTRSGYITPHGGGGEGLLAVVAELRAAVQHLNTMPANQVVMNGAHGFVRALDHDAGLIRLVSQRQRLA